MDLKLNKIVNIGRNLNIVNVDLERKKGKQFVSFRFSRLQAIFTLTWQDSTHKFIKQRKLHTMK